MDVDVEVDVEVDVDVDEELDVVVGIVVATVLLELLEEEVVPATTGIVTTVVVGIAHVTAAVAAPFNNTAVVNWNAFSVTLPDAGATAPTVMVGVVSVPGGNGPGFPVVILSVAVNEAVSTMVCVAPPAVGASVAVPGFTMEPGVNVVPLI